MPDLAELTVAWAGGWAVSRGTPPPVETTRGLVISLDESRHVARYVLHPDDWGSAATAEGQALYAALGWTNRGELAGAFRDVVY
jgi:hypothetical protein